ncbi:MAG: hypothetical protein JSU92_07235, partial [Deltaproteobacteria bacterium]
NLMKTESVCLIKKEGKTMKKLLAFLLAISLVTAFSVIPAEAKDLTKRIGLGFTSQGGDLLRTGLEALPDEGALPLIPSISLKIAVSEKLAFGGYLGYRTASIDYDEDAGGGELSGTALALGAKSYYNFLTEDNMNLYAGGGLGYTSFKSENGMKSTSSAVDLLLYMGGEFFLQGLPNLGFSFEVGLDVMVTGSSKDEMEGVDIEDDLGGFGTFGGVLGAVGIHYYF